MRLPKTPCIPVVWRRNEQLCIGGLMSGQFSETNGLINWSRGWFRLWVVATLLWLAAVAVFLVVSPQIAWHLRGPGTETFPVPACKSGQPTCTPWDRNWDGVELPAGTIVSNEGFTPPGAYSPWRVAPVALVPPGALFIVGWLTGWVVAGFRKTPSRR